MLRAAMSLTKLSDSARGNAALIDAPHQSGLLFVQMANEFLAGFQDFGQLLRLLEKLAYLF
jgi:hypothetical protein